MALLKIGSSGSSVRQLQEQLNSYGFNAGKADGIFGKNTASALKAFQAQAGLTADGIYGNKSASALSGYKAPTATTPMTAPPTTLLKSGSSGSSVTQLQNQLNAYGFNAGTADGIFGSNTAAALKAFQAQAGLVSDGIYGTKSAAALAGYKAPAANTTANPVTTGTTPTQANVQNPAQAATPAASSASGMSQDEYREKLMASARAGIMSEYDANVAIIKNNLATALSNFQAEQAALQPIFQRNIENIAQNQFTSEEAAKEMMNQGGWTGANSGLAIGEQTKIANAADKNRADAQMAYSQDEADINRRQTLAQQTYGNEQQAQELYKNQRLSGAEADAMMAADERNRGIYESDRAHEWDQEQARMAQEQANRAYEWQREQAAQNQSRWETEYNRSVLESDRNYALQQAAAARAKASGGGGGGGGGGSGSTTAQYSQDEFMAWVAQNIGGTGSRLGFLNTYESMMNDPDMSNAQKSAIQKEYKKKYDAELKAQRNLEASKKASQARYQF